MVQFDRKLTFANVLNVATRRFPTAEQLEAEINAKLSDAAWVEASVQDITSSPHWRVPLSGQATFLVVKDLTRRYRNLGWDIKFSSIDDGHWVTLKGLKDTEEY